MADFLQIDSLYSAEEKLMRNTIRRFVDSEIMPIMTQAFEDGQFPLDLIDRLSELKIFGMTLPEELGGISANEVAYGLVCQELERADSSLRSFVSVQNALCIYPIFHFGSDKQKQKFLKKMIQGKLIGCFALTEPDAGSDPASLKCQAKKVDNGYLLSGNKAWITNAPIADIAIVWAKTDGNIRGFIVERDFNGFFVTETKHKLSMRASFTGELKFDECFVPNKNLLPKTDTGLLAALKCLNEARYGIAWGALGCARHCYDIALEYACGRTQFNKPIAANQLIQKDLVDMLTAIVKGQLLNIHMGRLKDEGKADFQMISMAKMSNSYEALKIARLARNILGANGISLEFQVIRHMANLETVFTYEGTDNIHHLLIGKHITGLNAF
jgi:glutaryl-CoA dehydrogenase